MKPARIWIGCLWILPLLARGVRAQETPAPPPYTEIPGTRVSLRLPPGFSQPPGFPGIVQEELRAALVTVEIRSALSQVLAEMTPQDIAAENMTLLRSEPVTVSGRAATLFHIAQPDPEGDLRKWIVLFGDEKLTVMLAASAPAELEPALGKLLETCLLTAQWDPAKALDLYAGLGFSLRESEIFEIRGRRPGGVLLTRREAPEELTPAEPILVVFPLSSPAVAPLAATARQALTEGSQFVEFANFSERPLVINGLNGYEIIADAKEASQSIPVRILLVAVRAGDRDMIIEGIVETAGWEKYLPEFRGLAESFQITPAGHAH